MLLMLQFCLQMTHLNSYSESDQLLVPWTSQHPCHFHHQSDDSVSASLGSSFCSHNYTASDKKVHPLNTVQQTSRISTEYNKIGLQDPQEVLNETTKFCQKTFLHERIVLKSWQQHITLSNIAFIVSTSVCSNLRLSGLCSEIWLICTAAFSLSHNFN